MELVKLEYADDCEKSGMAVHFGICGNKFSDEVGIDVTDDVVKMSTTDIGFVEITDSAWDEIMPHHEDDEGQLSEIIARLMNRMDYDFVRLFRHLLYKSWPQVKTDMVDEIEYCQICTNDVKKEKDEFDAHYGQEWIELYTNQIERLKWLSNADDAMIVGLMQDSLSHVARMMESDMIEDTGHSIN
jgi:hypothetical protein